MTKGGVQPGVNHPDRRGRIRLDQVGRDLTSNPDVIIRDVEVTSEAWHVLRRTTFDYRRRDGRWKTQQRETYDRGNGATILLYDTDRRTVLLTPSIPVPRLCQRSPRRAAHRDCRGPA
jgi:hypothetical protein